MSEKKERSFWDNTVIVTTLIGLVGAIIFGASQDLPEDVLILDFWFLGTCAVLAGMRVVPPAPVREADPRDPGPEQGKSMKPWEPWQKALYIVTLIVIIQVLISGTLGHERFNEKSPSVLIDSLVMILTVVFI